MKEERRRYSLKISKSESFNIYIFSHSIFEICSGQAKAPSGVAGREAEEGGGEGGGGEAGGSGIGFYLFFF